MTGLLYAATLLAAAAPLAQAAAPPPSYETPDYIRKPPVLPPRLDAGRAWRLSLEDAVETAIRRNLDLALQRERQVEIDTGRSAALGGFEPGISATLSHADARIPPATAQEGAAGAVFHSAATVWNLSLTEHLPTATDISLSSTNVLNESTQGTAVEPKVFRSGLSLTLNQPLLRNFSPNLHVPRVAILRADFTSASAMEETRLRAMLTVKATEDAYWSLVQSYKIYEVNVGASDLAAQQLALTRRQIEAGVLPESDVIGVEGTLAQRQLAVVRAEVQIDRSADALRALLYLPASDWDRPLVPLDAPAFAAIAVPFDRAFDRALSSRPELRESHFDLKRVALDLEVARNARLPRLDLQASLGSVGQDDVYRQTLDQLSGFKNRQWSVGLSFGWAPLGVAARAEIRRLQSSLRETTFGREQIVSSMRVQVREALRAIDAAARQLEGSARFRSLAERSLEVEQRRFLNGLSSNFVIAQRQADLAQARQAELEALIQHEKAASDLQLAMGELLESHHVQFVVHPAGG
jgi:outer membrane protein TolC